MLGSCTNKYCTALQSNQYMQFAWRTENASILRVPEVVGKVSTTKVKACELSGG